MLGVTAQAEAVERGYFSPSIAVALPAPLRQDTAATSTEGMAWGLHDGPWVLWVRAIPESPPRSPSSPAPQNQHVPPLSEAIPGHTAPASRADGGRRPATGTGQSVLGVDVKREDIKINTKQLACSSRAEQAATAQGSFM